MVVGLLPWRWGISGMSNLIVGVHGGGGVGGLGVREVPLITGARSMWNRSLLKPLKDERVQLLHSDRLKSWRSTHDDDDPCFDKDVVTLQTGNDKNEPNVSLYLHVLVTDV